MDTSSKQNINQDIVALKNVLDEMDLTETYKKRKHTFFSNVHGIFLKIDHRVSNKTSLNKFKKIEIISNIFSDHKGLKLENNLKEKNPKHSKLMQIK